ncbi:hypothetical protein ACFO5K_23445 [Nocardia halotolerans]|uniref:Lipoprotein LpqE n=1 Tax=Nocardia halotolerans TaxID=1755878 RepID=A0ABV8VQ50_9NOCA
MTALKAVTAPSARRRMVTVAALAAAAGLALTGCSAGQHTQTSSQAPAINGNNADIGAIALRNVHIVYPESADGHGKGGKAALALTIVNSSETVTDELTSVSTDLGPITITPPGGDGKFELEPQQTVAVGPVAADAAPAGDDHHDTTPAAPTSAAAPTTAGGDTPSLDPQAEPAKIEIDGLAEEITPGLTYSVTFNFKDAGTVEVAVPVDAADAERIENDMSGPAPEGAGGH